MRVATDSGRADAVSRFRKAEIIAVASASFIPAAIAVPVFALRGLDVAMEIGLIIWCIGLAVTPVGIAIGCRTFRLAARVAGDLPRYRIMSAVASGLVPVAALTILRAISGPETDSKTDGAYVLEALGKMFAPYAMILLVLVAIAFGAGLGQRVESRQPQQSATDATKVTDERAWQ